MDGKANEVLLACGRNILKENQPELSLLEEVPGTFKAIFGGRVVVK